MFVTRHSFLLAIVESVFVADSDCLWLMEQLVARGCVRRLWVFVVESDLLLAVREE